MVVATGEDGATRRIRAVMATRSQALLKNKQTFSKNGIHMLW